MAPATKTKNQGVASEFPETALDRIDHIDRMGIRIGRRLESVREERALVGRRGIPGNLAARQNPQPATGLIAAALREIDEAQRAAARETGESADADTIAALAEQVKVLEARADGLEREFNAIAKEAATIPFQRASVLREEHVALVENARRVVAEIAPRWDTLAAAAADVEDGRRRAQEAIILLSGHPGAQVGASNHDEQERKALSRSFAPYVGAAPADNARWEAVSLVSAPPRPAPAPAEEGAS
jgi:hypothetical protein